MATPAAVAAAIPSRQTLVERARALIPTLKARSEAAIAARCLPPETIRDLQDAGFFRVLQPRRYGGYEHDPQVFYDIQMTLAEGCMSTAWVYWRRVPVAAMPRGHETISGSAMPPS